MGARDVLLGIGTGLLAATLLFGAADQLQLTQKLGWSSASSVADSNPTETNQDKQPKATADWKQEAAQAGMTVLPKAEYDQKLEQAHADGAKQKADELAGKGADKVYVYIQPGMGTNDVALLLQAAGVLNDGNQLIQLRQNQRNPIRAGTYQLPLKADPKEVMKMIATPPQ